MYAKFTSSSRTDYTGPSKDDSANKAVYKGAHLMFSLTQPRIRNANLFKRRFTSDEGLAQLRVII